LSDVVRLSDSIGYPISDVGKPDNGSLIIRHVAYTY
jgi:hypothetical protein